jgi:hypothetical protein
MSAWCCSSQLTTPLLVAERMPLRLRVTICIEAQLTKRVKAYIHHSNLKSEKLRSVYKVMAEVASSTLFFSLGKKKKCAGVRIV